jgi:hypothetical protein
MQASAISEGQRWIRAEQAGEGRFRAELSGDQGRSDGKERIIEEVQ